MRNQSQEIIDYIKENPGACTEDIVQGTGWNRHLVEMATDLMVENGLIAEVSRTDWNDPQFEVTFGDMPPASSPRAIPKEDA